MDHGTDADGGRRADGLHRTRLAERVAIGAPPARPVCSRRGAAKEDLHGRVCFSKLGPVLPPPPPAERGRRLSRCLAFPQLGLLSRTGSPLVGCDIYHWVRNKRGLSPLSFSATQNNSGLSQGLRSAIGGTV